MSSEQDLNMLVSRRTILHYGACGAIATPLIALTTTANQAGAQDKQAQEAVAYQASPKGDQTCEGCKLFEAPKSCKMVAGDISPQGWCKIWIKK